MNAYRNAGKAPVALQEAIDRIDALDQELESLDGRRTAVQKAMEEQKAIIINYAKASGNAVEVAP